MLFGKRELCLYLILGSLIYINTGLKGCNHMDSLCWHTCWAAMSPTPVHLLNVFTPVELSFHQTHTDSLVNAVCRIMEPTRGHMVEIYKCIHSIWNPWLLQVQQHQQEVRYYSLAAQTAGGAAAELIKILLNALSQISAKDHTPPPLSQNSVRSEPPDMKHMLDHSVWPPLPEYIQPVLIPRASNSYALSRLSL